MIVPISTRSNPPLRDQTHRQLRTSLKINTDIHTQVKDTNIHTHVFKQVHTAELDPVLNTSSTWIWDMPRDSWKWTYNIKLFIPFSRWQNYQVQLQWTSPSFKVRIKILSSCGRRSQAQILWG